MKKIILFSLLSYLVTDANSQTDNSSFTARWDSLFRNFIDLSSVSTGYLWEKGLPDSSVWFFTGKKGDSIATYEHWSNTYQYWINASNSQENVIVPYDTVWKRLNALFKQGIYAVPLLHAEVNSIRPSAFDSGFVTLDTVSGTWVLNNDKDVFDVRRTVISAPFIQVFFKPLVKLYFGNDLYFTNTGTSIRQVRIQLNQGLFVDMPLGLTKEILLPTKGTMLMTIEYTLDNNEVYYSHTILVNNSLDGDGGGSGHAETDPFHFGDENGNIYAKPLRETETKEPLGAFVDYITGRTNGKLNTCIGKPIIFVEGIDFGYKDHPTGCYGGKCGNLGLKDLRYGEIYNPYEPDYKNWYEPWDAITKAPLMIAELEKKGYDLFYIDFHNGADYMENNAMLLVELIGQINSRKCTNEEIVIIGASMGGQIAKYALSYMEKNNLPHCTRTYLSFDSPHQGANIPLGLQYQLEYYMGKLPGVRDKYERKLNRAATKQLLVYHCMSGHQASAHGLRQDFMGSLYGLGNYPVNTRNIALINGSITSDDQGYKAGEELLSINPYGGKIIFDFLRVSSTVFACYNNDEGVNIVLEAKFPFKKKAIKVVPTNTRQYDHVPGAKRFDLKESRLIYVLFNVINRHDASSFIPSTSSLDVHTADSYYPISSNISNKVPDNSKYPFHTYFGPSSVNEEHSQITDDNIRWMVDEIEKNRIELPVVLNTIYNYGQYERFLFRSTRIVANGKLQFNGYFKTGFGNGIYDKIPLAGSNFESYTTDCSPLITIDAGGQMVIGDNNTGKNKAIVHFRKGSTLVIRSGGILKIHDHSQLIIEEGAKLVYYPGAKIVLEGNDAMLQLDGTLRLEADAVFGIEKGAASSTGFIKYRNVGGGYGHANIEVIGNNTRISLEGTGKSSDHLLQVEGEMILPDISPSNRLKELKISNGMVKYGNNSRIITGAGIHLQEVKFENLGWAEPHSSDALWINKTDNCYINNCTFSALNYGVRYTGGTSVNNLVIEYSVFDHCNTGFQSSGRGVNMTGNVFTYCKVKGLYLQAPANDTRILECQFRNNLSGIEVDNNTLLQRHVFILNSTFHFNLSGVDIRQCITTISCSQFIYNTNGLSIVNGELNLSRTRLNTGNLYTSAGGNNTFVYNQTGIKLSGTLLDMNNGYNNFIQNNGMMPYQFITGHIVYNKFMHLPNPPYPLLVSNNYWQPAPKGSLMNGATSHYSVMFPSPAGTGALNFYGSMLPNVNTTCYKPGCNPCDQMIQDKNEFTSESLKDESSALASIKPYPVNNELKIEFLLAGTETSYAVRLINMEGQVVYETVSVSHYLVIDATGFAEGIYLLEITGNERREIKKVLIRR